jgi:hypothetical protein
LWLCVLLGWDATGAELMLEWTMVNTMTGRIDSAGERTTTIMGGFTFMRAVRTVFIITLHKTSEDSTTSATANITNSIIANILSRRTNIPDTPGTTQDRKNGGIET